MANTCSNFRPIDNENPNTADNNSDIEEIYAASKENRSTISDIFGDVFRKKLKALPQRQKQIVAFVKSKGEAGADFKDINKEGYSLSEVMELAQLGFLKPSQTFNNRFVYREFLTPKKR